MILKRSDIIEEFFGCPYCGTERASDDYRGCCGESSAHFCRMVVDKNDEVYMEEDVEIIEDLVDETDYV